MVLTNKIATFGPYAKYTCSFGGNIYRNKAHVEIEQLEVVQLVSCRVQLF